PFGDHQIGASRLPQMCADRGGGPHHNAVNGDARADCGPVKRLQQRFRQGKARALDQDTGERRLIETHFPHLCQFHAMGVGFTRETQDRERDIAAARAGWEKAEDLIRDPAIRLVLLDEINIALRYDYLDIAEVLDFLATEKPPLTHVVLTGRNAKPDLI